MAGQRTHMAQYLQSVLYLRRPFILNPITTLNTKLGVHPDLQIPPDQYPEPKFLAIGDGGHRLVTKAGGRPVLNNIPHRARHSALYNQLPFVLREVNADLSAAQRSGYALRKRITVGSQEYYAYYLKRLNLNAVETSTKHVVTESGSNTVVTFVPTNNDLNPEPPAYVADGTNVTRAEYLVTETPIQIVFTAADRDEFMNVARILYNDEDMAIISEMALVSGADRQVTGQGSDGQSINYMECAAAQINHFFQTKRFLKDDTQGFVLDVGIGGEDPMLVEE